MQCVTYVKHCMSMIEIKKLSFGYSRFNFIFQDIDLSIQKGIYIIAGENGVGKTTLLHLVSGLCFPHTGDCLINNKSTCDRSADLLKELFFLPEELKCPTEPILDFAHRHARFYPSFEEEILMDNLREMGIDGKKKMSELSFGQRKKALIAYTLALKTSVILLDEPTNGLDILSKQTLQRLIAKNIGDDQTLLISTHTINDFRNLYDHIIFLVDKHTVINESLESISFKLLFAQSVNPPPEALYYEQNLKGYFSILANPDGMENTIDPELLYRGILKNSQIKSMLTNK